MAATGKVIGTVTAVVGEAKATAADGTVRVLQVGDKVYSDEAITTSEAGSINVALEGGKTLACDGSVDLALHESLLAVANASTPSSTPASDVDTIQRAIAAGQDPSQVASATAAGGAPAAGGNDLDGGSHDPVVLEQSNAASVVSSGFDTEGESLAFSVPQTESLQIAALAASTAPSNPNSEQSNSPSPALTVLENLVQGNVPADAPAIVTASASTPAQETVAVATEESQPQVTVEQPASEAVAPTESSIVVPATDPIGSGDDGSADEIVVIAPAGNDEPGQPGEDAQTPVVTDEVAQNEPSSQEEVVSAPTDDTTPSNDVPVVIETSDEEQNAQPPVITEQNDDPAPVIPTEDISPETPDATTPGSATLSYSISANTNQDEQLALLTFEDANGHTVHQSLVFFGQEGQQKPSAVPVALGVDYQGTVKLTYVGAFAGNSDESTGHTAQKIAIKDFGLGETGSEIPLADQSDGVNIGIGSKSLKNEASIQLGANGPVDGWDFNNVDTSTNQSIDYKAGQMQDGGQGFDILNVEGPLDLTAVDTLSNFEVISLRGSESQELTLQASDVLEVTGGEVMHIVGGKEDTLNLAGAGWKDADGNAISNTTSYQPSYFGWVEVKNGSTTLLIDPDVNIHVM